MDNILTELWYGNVSPWEQVGRRDGDQRRLIARLCESRDTLTADMTEAQKELLEKYDAALNELNGDTEKTAFIHGFCLGIRLLSAAIHTQTGE